MNYLFLVIGVLIPITLIYPFIKKANSFLVSKSSLIRNLFVICYITTIVLSTFAFFAIDAEFHLTRLIYTMLAINVIGLASPILSVLSKQSKLFSDRERLVNFYKDGIKMSIISLIFIAYIFAFLL